MPKFADNNDFMTTIVYILIALVGLAVSAYRNYNKQKEAQKKHPHDGEPEFPDVSLGPVFEYEPELPVDEEEVPVETYREEIVAEEKEEKPVDSFKPGYVEGEPDFESTIEALLEDQILTSESIMENDLTKQGNTDKNAEKEAFEFDVRKAIIFSEILNPKYSL